MSTVNSITTRDDDTIEAVETFRARRELPSYSEALEKLVGRARELDLHRRDLTPEQIDEIRRVINTPQPAAA